MLQDLESKVMAIIFSIVDKNIYEETRKKLSIIDNIDECLLSLSSLSLLHDIGIKSGSYVDYFLKFKESKHGIYKKENSNKIYEIMKKNGKMKRDEIIKFLNIPRTTVYDCLKEMIFCLDVMAFKKKLNNIRGRPNTIFILIDNESKIKLLKSLK